MDAIKTFLEDFGLHFKFIPDGGVEVSGCKENIVSIPDIVNMMSMYIWMNVSVQYWEN